ncbi:unnamed protein product [Lactuca virosa]|uniref:Uncharacterized protein n=1 Tax=Lactuca virosa TaxID=75947 RepID=A0AAU9N438_9ASTR|nr:unnamed protein product [Lactuca virosa]
MDIDFKDNETLIPVNQNHSRHTDSGSDSAFIGSWGSSSSSSFLTPSFGSELDSTDADPDDGGDDDDDFIAQLSRQMADYMLEEKDDNRSEENPSSKDSGFQKQNIQEPTYNPNQEKTRRSYADTVKKSIVGFQSEQSLTNDKQIQPPIQLYQVEHQPRVGGQSGAWGRRGKMSELTQHMTPHRPEVQMHGNKGVRGNKEFINGGKGYHGVHGSSTVAGSGMRAIFLGGSGSQNVMNGTGVFLPRSTTDATVQGRKKTGCSTVLVPTRVLQALEQHFNNMESLSSSKKSHIHPNRQDKNDRKHAKELSSMEQQKSKLPQEWTY